MKKLILASITYLFTTLAVAQSCNEYLPSGKIPTAPMILCKNGFVIGYSPSKKSMLWAAERIDPNKSYQIHVRPAFHKDSSVKDNEQSSNKNFVKTGYDKGHMVPFEDMSYSEKSAYDSMSLTNIVPQNYINNRGGWKTLEMRARKMAQNHSIYVISGPIFDNTVQYLEDGIPIPTKLFKIIVDPTLKTVEVYILPNSPVLGEDALKMKSSISAVSQLTGINLLP